MTNTFVTCNSKWETKNQQCGKYLYKMFSTRGLPLMSTNSSPSPQDLLHGSWSQTCHTLSYHTASLYTTSGPHSPSHPMDMICLSHVWYNIVQITLASLLLEWRQILNHPEANEKQESTRDQRPHYIHRECISVSDLQCQASPGSEKKKKIIF